jgi:hypothetical protein
VREDTSPDETGVAASTVEPPRDRVSRLVRELGTPRADAAIAELAAEIAAGRAAREAAELDAAGREALLWAAATLLGDDPQHAEDLGTLAREVTADGAPHLTVYGLGRLAQAAFSTGRLDIARRLAAFALRVGERGAWTEVQEVWYLRSEIARKAGRWDEVEHCLTELRAWLHEDAVLESRPDLLSWNRGSRSRYHLGRARMLLAQGLLEEAQDELAAGEEAAERSDRAEARAYAASVALEVAMMRRQSFESVIAISSRLAEEPWIDELPKSHWMLFRAIEGTCWAELERLWIQGVGEPVGSLALTDSRARALLTEALESGLLGVPDRITLLTLLADGALLRGDAELALEHLDACAALAAPRRDTGVTLGDDALAVALRWRALHAAGTADGAEMDAAYDALHGAFDQLLTQWDTVAPRPGGVGFLHLEWRTYVVETLIDAALERGGDRSAERALEHVIASQAMGSIARERGVAAPALEDVRDALLDDGRMLLLLSPGRTGSHLFVMTTDALDCFRIGPYEALRELADPVAQSLRPGARPAGTKRLAALRDALLPGSVQEQLREASGVYALGFDRLQGAVLAGLPLAGGRPAAETLAVSEIASLPLAVAHARERGSRAVPLRMVVLVAPDAQGLALDDLPFGDAEQGLLQAGLDPEHVEVLAHERATAQALLARETLDGVDLLLVLAHAVPDEGAQGGARLVLADATGDGPAIVGAAELRELGFRGVVVLASCGSAKGPSRLGDDALSHLGGALLEGGALAVVLARDRVEYRRTLALCAALLEHVAAGASTAEALREAYAATLGKEPWTDLAAACFQVIGLGFDPASPREPR